jgi:hypothetical protein
LKIEVDDSSTKLLVYPLQTVQKEMNGKEREGELNETGEQQRSLSRLKARWSEVEPVRKPPTRNTGFFNCRDSEGC